MRASLFAIETTATFRGDVPSSRSSQLPNVAGFYWMSDLVLTTMAIRLSNGDSQ